MRIISLILVILWQLQLSSGGYDSSQGSVTIKRTLPKPFGGDCQKKCEDDRPKDQCEDHERPEDWKAGKFNCYDKSRSGYSCTCRKCQRHDCSIDETGYAPGKCDIATIQHRTQDLKAELIDLTYNHFANMVGVAPVVGPLFTMWMNTAKGAYGIYKNDKHSVLNGVIDDMNRQVGQLKDCMDEKIDVLEAQTNLNEMQDAWYLFDVAANYAGDDVDDLMDHIKDAWTEHLLVANSEFDDIDGQSATYFKKLLLPLQSFTQTFAQVSTNYLNNVHAYEPVLYSDAYERTTEGFRSLQAWAIAALDVISKDMDKQSHELPCENGKELAAGLAQWKDTFTVANIDPIGEYLMMIESMNDKFQSTILPGDACENVDESTKIIRVLSTEHSDTDEGKYFNFDKAEADAIIGYTDWNGKTMKTLRVYNERTGMNEDIVIWSSSEVSDNWGHGRRSDKVSASEGNWQVGDVLVYRPNSYSTCGDEYECIQGTCQSSYTPIDDSSRQCSARPTVDVLSVEHSKFGNGKYFNFDIAQMDAAMGEGNWESRAVSAYNYRTGRVVNVYMWRKDGNGDSAGDGHGRLAYGETGTLDWQIGDELAFNLDSSECGEGFYCVPSGDDEASNICQHARCNADDKLPFIDVNAINKEGSLTFGQYFRFDAASMDLDNLLGADWESKSVKVYNSRTKEVMKIRIWSAEGGHGRKDPKDASTTDDFQYGDRLIFNYGSADGCGDNLSCVPVGDDDDFACIAGLSFGDVVSLSE